MQELLGETPFIGETLWIYKANQIIPQVSKAIQMYNKGADTFIPEVCPICGEKTEIIISDSGVRELYCTNADCSGKLINKLEHFVSKKGLDIKGLSKATLSKLIDWGWVNSISDLFKLKDRAKMWMLKPGFGEKSVTKIIDAIEEARHTTLEKYLSAISIPLIGKTYARELALTFGDYESFREEMINYFDFESLEGFGPAMHEAIVTFDYSEADSLVDDHIVDFTKDEVSLENSGNAHSLEGLSIAITGKLKLHKNRDELKSKIEAAGGKVVSSVSSKTNYLVNNDNTSDSAKNKTAKSLNIPIITEEELMQLL